uniref:MATH domain-containing protein n=1 Tax=Parastrongyloides trichosuri TaxID=131310 RepID=A0A0N5A1E2_PARTI
MSVCKRKEMRSLSSISDEIENLMRRDANLIEKFYNMREYSMLEDLTDLFVNNRVCKSTHIKCSTKRNDMDDMDINEKSEFTSEVINIITRKFNSTSQDTSNLENFKAAMNSSSSDVDDKISEFTNQFMQNNGCSNEAGPSSKPCAFKMAQEEVIIIDEDDSDCCEDSSEDSCKREKIGSNNKNVVIKDIPEPKFVPEKPSKLRSIFSNYANSLSFCIGNIYNLKSEIRSAIKVINGVGWRIFATTHYHKNHSDPDKSLSFYVQCCPNSYDDRWKVRANCEISIYSHANKCWKVCYQFGHIFNHMYDDCGLVHFMKWKDLFNSNEKYVMDGKIYLEAIIDVKGPVQITSLRDYSTRLKMFSDIFHMQMEKGNKKEAEEVCDLAINYCLKTDHKTIKKFENKRSQLVRNRVEDTINRLQQEHLQNVEKGTALKKRAHLRNFCFTGICKRRETSCKHGEITKNGTSCSGSKDKKTFIHHCDNVECESNRDDLKNPNKFSTLVERKIKTPLKVCDCANNIYTGSLKTCNICEDHYFMRTLFFERRNYMFPFTVYNKKKLFILPENYIVGGDGLKISDKKDKAIEKFIRETSLEKKQVTSSAEKSSKKSFQIMNDTLKVLSEDDKLKSSEPLSVHEVYYGKMCYFNFVAKRTSMISRYLEILAKNTSAETRKLITQFYQREINTNDERLKKAITCDALSFYMRLVPFWVLQENNNQNYNPLFLKFNNDCIHEALETTFRSMCTLKSIPNGSFKEDKKLCHYINDKKHFVDSFDSVCIAPQLLIDTMRDIMNLWSLEYTRYTTFLEKKLYVQTQELIAKDKKYDLLNNEYMSLKQNYANLSKTNTSNNKTTTEYNELKKELEELKKEHFNLVRSNQSMSDSKKSITKELANLKEQNKLLVNQIQEKNTALKKLKKASEQEKIASNKENENLKARCIRSELLFLEKTFSIGIKELNKVKEEALCYVEILKELLNDKKMKHPAIIGGKINEYEEYIKVIDEQIETAIENHKKHSSSIEEGKHLSQIGKIKIHKPKPLPEKLNLHWYKNLDVVDCDDILLQTSPVRNRRVASKETTKQKIMPTNRRRLNSSPTSDAFSCSSGESRKPKDVFTDCGYYNTSASSISYDNTLNTFDVNGLLTGKCDNKYKYGIEYQQQPHRTIFSPTNSSSSFEAMKFSNPPNNIFGKQEIPENNRTISTNLDYIPSIDDGIIPKVQDMSQWFTSSDTTTSQNNKALSQDTSFNYKKYTRDPERFPSDNYQALYKAFCSTNTQKSDW